MNRKLLLTLAVSGAFTGLAGGVYAQEAPKPEGEKPELQQLVPQLEIALPWFVADGDEDKKPEQPQLIADGDEDKKPEQPQLIADGDEDKKPEQPQLIADGDDEKKPESPQLMLS